MILRGRKPRVGCFIGNQLHRNIVEREREYSPFWWYLSHIAPIKVQSLDPSLCHCFCPWFSLPVRQMYGRPWMRRRGNYDWHKSQFPQKPVRGAKRARVCVFNLENLPFVFFYLFLSTTVRWHCFPPLFSTSFLSFFYDDIFYLNLYFYIFFS